MAPAAPVAVTPAKPAAAAVVPAAPAAPAAPVVPVVPVAPAKPVVPAPAPVVAPAAVVAAAEPAVAGSGKVHVQFNADCWTSVIDGNGKVLFSAIKRKGDSLDVSGKPPFAVRFGYAKGVQLSYNGQPVDLAPFTSGETARLKLGQ